MRAHYLVGVNSERGLYIPQNLVVVENQKEDWFDIRYTPEELNEFERLWGNARTSLLANLNIDSVKEVEVDEGLVSKFRNAFDICELHLFGRALELFKLTEKEVEGSCVG